MKLINYIIFIVILLIISISCDDLQKNIENKANEIKESADKEIDKQLNKVDSTINQFDTTLKKKLDSQLYKTDSLINQIHEEIINNSSF